MPRADIEEVNQFAGALDQVVSGMTECGIEGDFELRGIHIVEFAGTLDQAVAEMDAAQNALQLELREWTADLLKGRFALPTPLTLAERRFNGQGQEIVCAWCHPGDHRPNISHGLCPAHFDLELAKLATSAAANGGKS
jgi:hypothetical protein